MKRLPPGISFSDPDLATAAEKYHPSSGFPPGTTVDELFLYRRKRPPAFVRLQDNIKKEEGSFQAIKSEYRREFRNGIYQPEVKAKKPEDSIKVEGQHEFNPEYYETFIEHPLGKAAARRPRNLINGLGMEVGDNEEKTDEEEDDQEKPPEAHPHYPVGRHYLFRRPTNLKLEGDLYTETENAEKFIEYLLTGRPDLARTPTTLKLEGDMETKTENRDKYVPFEHQNRPPLFKKSTNLHLEGVLDISTENRAKYLPFQPQQRAPLTKRGTNLHLEGDLRLLPEYRDVYVEHKEPQRSRPKFPVNNLKTEGCLDTKTEKSEKFVDHQIHPVIPFLRGGDYGKKFTLGDDTAVKRAEYKEKFIEHPRTERHLLLKPKGNLKPEGDMETVTENKTQFVQKSASKAEVRRTANNLLLEGNLDMNPEYRNAYVNFYRDAYGKFGIKKDDNEPEKRRRRTASNLKAEGRMDTNAEYKSSFVDFPRQRPSVKKPEGHLHSEGNWSHVTEKGEHYIAHPKGSKAHPVKRRTELKLEGPFECQPEYRRAYVDFIQRERVNDRQPRELENLGVPPQRLFPESVPHTIMEVKEEKEEKEEKEKKEEQAAPEAPPPSDAGEGTAALPEAKSKLPVPVAVETHPDRKSARRPASLSPSPRPSTTKANKENISKMENCLFGPKVPNPSSRSRRESPKSQAERRANEANARSRLARARRRYGSPVIVENLAFTPRTSPVPALLEASARGRWKRDDDGRKDHAFVVLRSVEAECNNNSNNVASKQCDRNRVGHRELYKEQKWMPSWYAPPSK